MSKIESAVEDRLNHPDLPAIIIGEIGSNFGGSLKSAIEMIEMVAAAGCDFAKFQIFRADWLVQKGSYAPSVLAPFDIEAVALLAPHSGPSLIKIASPEVHDLPLIRAAARTEMPIVISSGLMTMEDIQVALDCIREEGNPTVCCLHCVSDYPTEPADCNLGMIGLIAERFGVPSGLSDHSPEISIPMAAVALGARVIEKHVTMDRTLDGPDHHFALEPGPLREMVQGIRQIELALGKETEYPIRYSAEKRAINNKAMVANEAIPAGVVISADMLTVKRVRTGVRPRDINSLVGKKALTNIAEDEVVDESNTG